MRSDNHIQSLLKKFVLNQCSKEEIEDVIGYIQYLKNSSEFLSVEDVLEILDEKPKLEEIDANRIHDNLIKIIKQ